MDESYTPGISYSVPAGEVMVAMAPGILSGSGKIEGTGRAGGGFVEIKHTGGYVSNFSHIGELVCGDSERIRRGDPICKIPMQYADIAKVIFWDHGYFADPDNYGENHSYMRYLEDSTVDDESLTPRKVGQGWEEQEGIVKRLDSARLHASVDPLLEKWHNKGGYKPTRWSTIEKFR
jgi:hypothetical protein